MERSERGGGREICNATREEETSPDVVGGGDWRTLFLFCVVCKEIYPTLIIILLFSSD